MARRRRKLVVRDRRKTALRIAVTFVSLIALAGLGVLAFFLVRSCSMDLTQRELPLVRSDTYCGTGDGLMYIRADQLNFLSYTDEDKDFTKSLTGGAAPDGLVGSPGVKAVYSEYSVQIIGGGFDITAEGVIEKVRCGGAFAAVCSRMPNGARHVTAYSSAGQPLRSFDFDGGRLVDFGFSEASGSTLWIMELDTDSGSPRTTISTFDLERMSSTGVITVSDQLIERLYFTGSSVYAIGTESLIRYSASANREIYRVQLYGYRVEDITLSEGSPMLMLVPRGAGSPAEAGSVRLLTVSQKDVADETAVTVTLPEGTVGCHLCGGSLAVVSSDGVQLFSSKGEATEKTAFKTGLTLSSEKLDGKHILMERNGGFVLLTVGK